jgi:hypothetical protein
LDHLRIFSIAKDFYRAVDVSMFARRLITTNKNGASMLENKLLNTEFSSVSNGIESGSFRFNALVATSKGV